MTLRFLTINIRQLLEVRPGEAARIGFMAAFLFFLLAANNVIKIVRDALFLSRFPITQLPYVYLLAAVAAGIVISIYSRYTFRLSLSQVIVGSHVFIISNVIIFWLLIVFYDFGWVLYAFYIWSAIVGLIAVAQFWMLANDMFTPRDGKRLFGLLTAAGTLGGMLGGFGATLAVTFLFETRQLLWFIVALFAGALGVVWFAARERETALAANHGADVTIERNWRARWEWCRWDSKGFPLSSDNRSAYFSLGHRFDFNRLSVQGCGTGSLSIDRSNGKFLWFLLCLAECRHGSCPVIVNWKASDGFGFNPKSPRSPFDGLCGIDKPLGLARPFCRDSDPPGRSVPAHECQSQWGGDSLPPGP